MLEYVALGALVVNGILILILAIFLIKRKSSKKVDPLEYELMEHEDPEKLLMMKMISGEKLQDDQMMKLMMRDVIHNPKKKESHSHSSEVVDEYVREHDDHENFLHDKSKIKSEIKEELKTDVRDEIKKELRRRLNS